MTGIIRTNVAQYGLTQLIQRLGRDCSPTQFVREFTMNSIEAIQRTGEPGKVLVDVNWEYFDAIGVYKMCFIDTGDGMTSEEMRQHLGSVDKLDSQIT